MNLNKPPDNIREKPEERDEFIKKPSDLLKAWWKETEKRLKTDPHYLPIRPIPSEKELKEFELD